MKRKDFDEKLGQLLKEARNKKGYTQPYVAERMGVSKQAIFYWESGRRSMDAGTLFDFCDVLGIEANDLIQPLRKNRK